jgi:hypothetical protein
MATYTTQEQLVVTLRKQLSTNTDQALKALVVLFGKQTEDERVNEETCHDNKVGFTHNDAKVLSGMAKFYLDRGFLSDKQVTLVKSKVSKYARQLVKNSIATGKIRKENGCYVW